jgi:acyl-CoA thioesterase
MHAGRSFASDTVTAWQGDRLCARSLVLLDVDEPDLIRHAPTMPDVAGPEQSADGGARGAVFPGSEFRIVDDVDLYSLDAPVGPADLFLWTRFPDAPDDLTVNQAVLAWATDGYLIATAMRPHEGINQHAAHRTISTGVLAQTVVFHEPFSAATGC